VDSDSENKWTLFRGFRNGYPNSAGMGVQIKPESVFEMSRNPFSERWRCRLEGISFFFSKGKEEKMSREGIGMRKVKEIIRLNEGGKLSQNAIAKSCKVSSSTVGKILKKLNEKDVKKQIPGGGSVLSEQKIQDVLKGEELVVKRDMPEMECLAKELKRKGVTRRLLWEEYHEQHPEGYSYSQFCYIIQGWKKNHAAQSRETLPASRGFSSESLRHHAVYPSSTTIFPETAAASGER